MDADRTVTPAAARHAPTAVVPPAIPDAAPTEHLPTAADPLVLTDAARHAPTAAVPPAIPDAAPTEHLLTAADPLVPTDAARPAPTAAVPSEAAAQTATTAVAPGARLHGSLA